MRRVILILIFLLLVVGLGTFLFFMNKNSGEEHTLTLYGNVDVRQVDLGFRVSGRVTNMVFEEGDLVTPGTFMSTLDKQPYLDQVREAKAHVESFKLLILNAEKIIKRRVDLLDIGGVSDEEYVNAISSRDVYLANLKEAKAALGVALTNLRDTELYAPSEGTILTRIREPGTVVNIADPIYTVSITSPVWIRAFVSEPDLGRIYPGMEAEIYTDTKGAPVYHGHIGFISPVAEFTPKTVETTQLRTDLVYRLRVIADNPDKGLRQGMPVTVKLLHKKPQSQEGS